jgi:hypothetical protein
MTVVEAIGVDSLDRDRVGIDRMSDGARNGGEQIAQRRSLGNERRDMPHGSLLRSQPPQRHP